MLSSYKHESEQNCASDHLEVQHVRPAEFKRDKGESSSIGWQIENEGRAPKWKE